MKFREELRTNIERVIWLLFISSFILSVTAMAKVKVFSAKVKVENRGTPINAIIVKNRTYVDLDSLRKIFDLDIRWSYEEQILYVGKVGVDVSPLLIRGLTYVPIRDVARAAGYAVSWDQNRRTVILSKSSYTRKTYTSKANINVIEHNVTVTSVDVKSSKNANTLKSDSNRSSGDTKLELPPVPPREQKVEFTGSRKPTGAFIPRYSQNEEFLVTVTDLKETDTVKGFYHPQPNKKFIVVFVSQQNISNKIQVYTGRFYLVDDKGAKYDYIEGLSNYWLQVLIPNGINFGSLVFEIPKDRYPAKLVLETYGNTPLVVNLM